MPTKDYSTKQEKMIASFLGWSVVAGSGAAACFPGDVISDEWLGECKTHVTSEKKIFFSKSVWKKIKDEAATKHRFPVIFTDDGSQKSQNSWCLFSLNQIDFESCSMYALDMSCIHINISFEHNSMIQEYNKLSRSSGDKICVFVCRWSGDKIAICPLDTFRELFIY